MGSTIFELLGISSILLFLNAILDVEQSNFTTVKSVFENYFLSSNLGEINSLLFFLIVIFPLSLYLSLLQIGMKLILYLIFIEKFQTKYLKI